ncbi:hypothetical protein V6N13_035148 [Hibiscus sabdariffa]
MKECKIIAALGEGGLCFTMELAGEVNSFEEDNSILNTIVILVDPMMKLVRQKKSEFSEDKLNPEKCTFGVEVGKFLGFLISVRGIEANPETIKAIMDMGP